ncbi:Integrin-linked protein kinase-like pat-4 [Pseudocercospora fuligena]|uniref:Integrin-linked protein kinase-like pat-4 n=1 Tax=Pseudocercospora fuligena TaxID=685502 RepID=A0A8H6RI30_9PEZI|nr:Integrin-linked protein kinase-like pat-4 [Pseudocercospora fuligena]
MNVTVQQDGVELSNYSLALAAIPEDYRLMSRRILTWIAIASRPLTILELADACTIDWRMQPAVDETRSEYAYLTLRLLESSGLVHMGSLPAGHKHKRFHRDTGCGQLVDDSFRDYLKSEDAIPDFRIDIGQAHFEMAQDCIAYLCQFYTAERSGRARPDGSSNHFLRYAVQHWDDHQRKAEQALDDRACLGLVEAFLMDDQMRADWVRPRPSTDDESGIGSALYWSCALGLPATTERLLARGYHVDEVGGDDGTAIQVAAGRGRSGIVERLLAVGANISHDQGHGGTALQAACTRGVVAVVVMLLNAGADVNAGSSRARDSPLTIL